MTMNPKQIHMVIERKNQSSFGPKRDTNQTELPRNHRRPDKKRVCDHHIHTFSDKTLRKQLLHVSREHVQERRLVLVMVQRPVKPERKSVGDRSVPYVETRLRSNSGENIPGVDLVVVVMSVDESDGDPLRRELDG